MAWRNGSPAGYVELAGAEKDGATHVEIACLGLIRRFVGQGLGGQLLTEGVRHAWTLARRFPGLPPVGRVWLHTCSLDGPNALANYRGGGFTIYRTTEEDQPVADSPSGPWPGAHAG